MYTGATDKLALPKKRQRNELSTVILRAIILFLHLIGTPTWY